MKVVPINEVAELRVAYHNKTKPADRTTISCSEDAFRCLIKGYDSDLLQLQESFVVLYVNRANQLLGMYRHTVGTINSVTVDIRIILGVALKVCATSLIISHSHPSSGLTPSTDDKNLTAKLKDAAKLLDLRLLDHIIVSGCGERYYSFADEGLL